MKGSLPRTGCPRQSYRCIKSGTEITGSCRAVGLASVEIKTPEMVLRDRIAIHPQASKFTMVEQHGSWRMRSCLTDLIILLKKATSRTEKDERLENCYLDMQAAFDSGISWFPNQKVKVLCGGR